MTLVLPFFFSLHESHVISRFDSDETVQKVKIIILYIIILPIIENSSNILKPFGSAQTGRQSFPKVDLSQQDHFEGDILLPEKKPIGGIKPSAVLDSQIWPDKTIPYVISTIYSIR